MKRIYKDDQQEVYTYKGHKFSIIDLRVFPIDRAVNQFDIPEEVVNAFEDVMNTAIKYPYEVADVTSNHTVVIGRLGSGEEAIEFVREYCDQGLHKLRDEIEKDIHNG